MTDISLVITDDRGIVHKFRRAKTLDGMTTPACTCGWMSYRRLQQEFVNHVNRVKADLR